MAIFRASTTRRPLLGTWPGLLVLLALLATASCQSNTQTEEKSTTQKASDQEAMLASEQAPTPLYVRKNCASPEAKADLEALNFALDSMRKMPCTDRRSWYYQAALHNVPGGLGKNPYCTSFTGNASPLWGWNGCTHDPAQVSEYHFLIWHRLLTLHFERIVRELSGKKDFAMPYWDYTNPQHQRMPAIFTNKKNALYEADRYPALNKGLPIDTTKTTTGLDTAFIFHNFSYSLFDRTIDPNTHGLMHVYIGCGLTNQVAWNGIFQQDTTGGLMGNVPTAAFDPIFWVHHANIDYLWASWSRTKQGAGQVPSLDSMTGKHYWPYRFITAKGDTISYTMQKALDLAMHPDYRYDVLPAPAPTATAKADDVRLARKSPTQEGARVVLASAIVGKTVTAGQFTAQLPVAAQRTSLLKSATPRPSSAQPQRLLLQLVVSVPREPRNAYAVYVRGKDAQAAKAPLVAKRQLAGILTFFGIGHQHGSMPGMTMPAAKLSRTFLFDITDEVNAATFTGSLDVQVVPTGEQPVPITIEKLTLLTQAL